jgi:hypothetical protein
MGHSYNLGEFNVKMTTGEWAEFVAEVEKRTVAHNANVKVCVSHGFDDEEFNALHTVERSGKYGSTLYIIDAMDWTRWAILRCHNGTVLPVLFDPDNSEHDHGAVDAAPPKWDRWQGRPVGDIVDLICIL